MRMHALIASFVLGFAVAIPAQDPDHAARRQAYLDLSTSLRLLCVAAAPGEQDATVLAAMRRGAGVETSIVFVTSGEGGRSSVGPERGDDLRVVRMKECEASAGMLGAKALYLHLPDVGTPQPAAETLERWGEATLREGLTRAIRRFRPHAVVVGKASGTAPAGYRAAVLKVLPGVVKDAADPERFDDLLEEQLYPWRVRRVFVACAEADASAVVALDGKGPGAATTFPEIGARALAQHRSYGSLVTKDSAKKGTGFYRAIVGGGSLVTGLVGYDQEELELKDERDYRNASAVETKIVETGRALLDLKDGDPEILDRLLQSLAALQKLSATPLVSRRLGVGEWLEEMGYQDFFRRRANQLSSALRYALGLRIRIDTEFEPRAEGQAFPVDVKLSLGMDAKVTNVGVRLLESPWFVKNYIEQKNRQLTRDRPVFAYFKVRVKPKAPPTVSPADEYRTLRRFRPRLECEIGGRFRGERFAFVVGLKTPPVFAPVQLAIAGDNADGSDAIVVKFRTQGPLFRFGGRPEEEPLRFKLRAAAPEGVRVEPASVVVENHRSGAWSKHRFRVKRDKGRVTGPIVFSAQFIKKAKPEVLDESVFTLKAPLPGADEKP